MIVQGFPRGTVTFLFISPDGIRRPVDDGINQSLSNDVIRTTIELAGGTLFKLASTQLQAAFPTAGQALNAAINTQIRLAPSEGGTNLRMAIHAGAVDPSEDGDYRSPVLNRLGRLLEAGHGGQILLTQVAAELCFDSLSSEVRLVDLGEQRLKDLTRPERVYQAVVSGLPNEFPPLLTLNARPNNLQSQPTPMVGRVNELLLADELLARPEVRLLSVTGTGGAGKTRFSLQVAANHLGSFADGVFVVDLAATTDPALVSDQIAQVLGVSEASERSQFDGVIAHLRVRQILLVLDNLEQVPGVATVIAELLANTTRIKIIATSRLRLNLRGEHEIPIEPLPVPNLRRLPPLDALTQYESVRLFIDRALAVQPTFTVTNASAPAVAEICVRLDGLPLAIELAASWIRLLSPDQMLRRLATLLPMLIDGPRDLPVRHQTLRATIAWSYDLLSADEQMQFRRLAVFVGGARLDAIQEVTGGSDAQQTLNSVQNLVDHHLLKYVDDPDGLRLTMLETIREFASEQLEHEGEPAEVHQRHAQHFANLAAEAFPQLLTEQQVQWFSRLARDGDNLVAALTWSLRTNASQAVAMAADLWWFWYVRGQLHLGRSLLINAIEASIDDRSINRARLLHGFACMAYVMGDHAAAEEPAVAALALNRELGNERGIVSSLNMLGSLSLDDPPRAEAFYQESLAGSRQLGDRAQEAVTLLNLGSLTLRQQRFEGVHEYFTQALSIWRETGDLGSQAIALANLGNLYLMTDSNSTSAKDVLLEGLLISHDLGDQVGMLHCLSGLAGVLHLEGLSLVAARLYGAGSRLLAELGEEDDPVLASAERQLVDRVRISLGDEVFTRAMASGSGLGLEDALNEALSALGLPGFSSE